LSEESRFFEVKPMKRIWLASIIVLALVVIGIVIYLARPRADETGNAVVNEATSVQSTVEPSAPPALATCVGPMDSQISKTSLIARHKWADSLLLKGHMDAAGTELRNIATLDPGYPAINFEISDALLKSKHASEAKDAIKLQLEISDCLSKLPPSDMQAYCKSEWVSVPEGGCVQELAKINQEAHYEAGLIDAGLGRAADSSGVPSTGLSTLAPQPLRMPPRSATGTAATVQPSGSEAPPDAIVVAKLPPPPRIQSTEASEHVGQQATVCGVVVSKHTAADSNGKPTFVNLDHSPPDPTFTVVIWGSDAPAVGDFPETGRVCVTGTIAMYRGSPQIIVHDAQSWSRSSQ
jgi:hypothetical protein